MEDSEVKKLIQLLDEGVTKENAKVLLSQYGGGPDESKIIATKERNKPGQRRMALS